MLTMFNEFIPVNTRGKQRPRHTSRGGTYTPKETKDYENKLKSFFEQRWGDKEPITGAVVVGCLFLFDKPKTVAQKVTMHATKPDGDNCEKSVYDAFDFNFTAVRKVVMKKNREIKKKNDALPNGFSPTPLLEKPTSTNGRLIEDDGHITAAIWDKSYAPRDSIAGIRVIVIGVSNEEEKNKALQFILDTLIKEKNEIFSK